MSTCTLPTKKYIAENNIQLYTINAIDKAIEIGMGKRTNTILQSAFFKLANVMPIDEAVEYMKDAAKKSYGKKGDDIVKMNYKAIDAGVDAVVRSRSPPPGPTPRTIRAPKALKATRGSGQADPRRHGAHRPYGRRQPARFRLRGHVRRHSGSRVLPLTRSAASPLTFPSGTPRSASSATSAAYVCPHATIRPFCLTADEADGCARQHQAGRHQGQGKRVQVHHDRLSSGLHGLRRLRRRLPGRPRRSR